MHMCSIFLRVAGFACAPASLAGVVCCNSVAPGAFLAPRIAGLSRKIEDLLVPLNFGRLPFTRFSLSRLWSRNTCTVLCILHGSRSSARRVLRRGASVPSIEDMLALQAPRGFPFTAARSPRRPLTLLLVLTYNEKWDIHMRTRERELELEGAPAGASDRARSPLPQAAV